MDGNQVWSPDQQSSEIKPLTTTWIFKKKTDEDGNLSKFKAVLCVRGFNQKEGVDYVNVFSPTGQLLSVQLLLTLCSKKNFIIEQMDVKCAFLNGIPDKELYSYQPDGYHHHKVNNICKLEKSLYGLNQSPHFWHKALKEALQSIGLSPCQTDP
ncbi:hypothetical protein O181_049129 [Austropuccinia psidii MF-1]|uniref:Reverse transcriptase Ty1/copia-type domain-containing protein n=1 Tax=Austropuccinia psidii MF-1 TaxID=1389203 RepID=A0A9Q3DUA9_9BASI|nr:hypothetical protein [Austropuccinia psidii MF-1]